MTTTLTPPDRQLVALRDESERVVALAGRAGVELECLGVQPLFVETRLYPGPERSWVLAPATDDPLVRRRELAIPKPELRALARLLEADLDFPAVYLAHEVASSRLTGAGLPPTGWTVQPGGFTSLDLHASQRLVEPVPVPARTARVARRLGTGAGALLKVLGLGVPVAGAVAGATVSAGGAALRALALDPMVLGAWTLDRRADPGTPAAWFVLARWLW
jgi:hypothetical protein